MAGSQISRCVRLPRILTLPDSPNSWMRLRWQKHAPLAIQFHSVLVPVDRTHGPAIRRITENIKRLEVFAVEFGPLIRVIDTDAGLSILEANQNSSLLEILSIAGGQCHATLAVKGVIELSG